MRTVDMTKGSPIRLLLQFSIPILIGNLFQQAYTLADRIIVGRFVGDTAFSAIGATNALSMLFMSMCMGAAIATVMSEAIAAILCMIYAFRKVPQFQNALVHRRLRPDLIRKTVQVGVPTGLQYALMNGVVEVIARVALAVSLTANPFIGMWGIWMTTGLTWTVTAVFAFFRYRHGAWKNKTLV